MSKRYKGNFRCKHINMLLSHIEMLFIEYVNCVPTFFSFFFKLHDIPRRHREKLIHINVKITLESICFGY